LIRREEKKKKGRKEEEIGIRMRREEKGKAFLSIPMPFC